jgi:hypothetical protein
VSPPFGLRSLTRSRPALRYQSRNARANFPPQYQDSTNRASPPTATHIAQRPANLLRYRTPTTPIAQMRHVVAAIDDRPHHSGGGCTLDKQTPRLATVAFGDGPRAEFNGSCASGATRSPKHSPGSGRRLTVHVWIVISFNACISRISHWNARRVERLTSNECY